MKRGRFTDDQIIGIFKKHEAGLSAAELCRKHGISGATFYIYGQRAKYGGMDVSDAKRLKALQEENAKLKKLLADVEIRSASISLTTAQSSSAVSGNGFVCEYAKHQRGHCAFEPAPRPIRPLCGGRTARQQTILQQFSLVQLVA